LSQDYEYDLEQLPPAPVLPIRLSAPLGEPSVLLVALIDTGADMTVVPRALARRLRLPVVGAVSVRGVAGSRSKCAVHAAAVEVDGHREIIEVLGLGKEALAGRNLLNQWILNLDGPHQRLHLRKSK
jgi:predicted aspartyl protease